MKSTSAKRNLFFMGIVSFSLLFILFYKIGLQNIITQFKIMSWWYLPAIIILSLLVPLLGGINIWLLLKPIKKLPFITTQKHYLTSWAIGHFAFGRVGDASIIYFLKQEHVEIGKGLALVIVDKIITLAILTILTFIGALYLLPVSASEIIIYIIAASILGIPIVLLLYTKKGREFIKTFILKKYSKYFTGFGKANNILYKNPKIIIYNIILTLIRYVVMTAAAVVTFKSLGVHPPFFMTLLIIAGTQFISLIPISISGLGVREVAAVALFNEIGISPEVSFSRSIISLTVYYVASLIIALYAGKKFFKE